MRPERALDRIVRLALLSYPGESRRRYGEEIAETVRERLAEADRRRAFLLAVRECAGILASGARARLARMRFRRPSRGERSRPRRRRGMDLIVHDLRIAARGLFREPLFTLLAVTALALGIGAAIAIFTVYHAVLLRPLPFRNPEELVSIWEKNPQRGWDRAQVAVANYLDWRAGAASFADMAAHNDWLDERVLLEDGEPDIVLASEVTGSFFQVLGVPPLEGRVFADEHTWAGPEPVAVLSHRFWMRRFGGDRSIVDRTLSLDGVAHRVLGIMPEGFSYPFREADLWVPVAWSPERRDEVSFRRAHGMRVTGRLSRGSSIQQAEAELSAIAARLEAAYPQTNESMGVGATPLQEWMVGDAARPLQILMAAVGFVLLIACANVSNMLLARSSGRETELSIRSALGSGRGRLVLQGLLESLLLAGLGGSLGLVLGLSAIRPLLLLSPQGLPRLEEISAGVPVILFAIGITVASGIAFGVLPAWRGASLEPRRGLASGPRGASPGRSARRTTSLLVAGEVALTLPLVIGAGLMVRTLSELSRVEPGFDPKNVLVAEVMLPPTRYEDDSRVARFYRELLLELRAMPGVEEAAMSSRLPFGNSRWSSDFTAEGWPADRFGMNVRHDEVTPGLFRTMGAPLLRGRDFELSDDLEAPPVVIVNQALANRYFPGEDAIGRRVAFDRVPDEDSTWRTIVGIVGNVRRDTLGLEEEPSFYAPVLQDTTWSMHVLVRGENDPRALVNAVRERVRRVDPMLPLFGVTTLESVVAASLDRERFLLALLAAAGGMALVLASVGIFGVVLYTTNRRAREIGIRVALGARASSVIGLVLRGGLKPVVAGTIAGIVAAAVMARAMSSLLFEVEPLDPLTYASVIALVLGAAVAACLLPARWATRVDATSALRSE